MEDSQMSRKRLGRTCKASSIKNSRTIKKWYLRELKADEEKKRQVTYKAKRFAKTVKKAAHLWP